MNNKSKQPRPIKANSRKKGNSKNAASKIDAEIPAIDPIKSERIAKRLARAGLCSRRQAETWILAGRVKVNGKLLETPAFTVTNKDKIEVDDQPIQARERTRVWLYHKPSGVLTTNSDPEGRPTIFDKLPAELPRVLSVGRLDMNTEGLMLLTNDGGLARILELPATGWLRRYRVRAHGNVELDKLENLKDGIAVDGVLYGSLEATLDRQQGHNSWLTVSIREGKNREVKNVLGAIGLEVNRLIRLSYGPFQLGDLEKGEVREIRGRTLREQLGERLIREAEADFDAPLIQRKQPKQEKPTKPTGQKYKKKTPRGSIAQGTQDRLETRPRQPHSKSGKSKNSKMQKQR